jgi:CheY-like chemotaxis protein
MSTVMIVEDELDIAEALAAILETAGFRVIKAANGQDALDLLSRGERPSVTLLDLMMPVMSGWEFLAELEGDPNLVDLPVVVLSATAYSKDLMGRTFLRKPIDMHHLVSVVRDHADGKASNS